MTSTGPIHPYFVSVTCWPNWFYFRMSGSTSAQSSDTKKKTSSYDRDRDHDKVQPKPIPGTYCMGCNRPGHTREDCHHKNHPDFNRGMDARPIENLGPEERQERRLSSREDFDPMVQ